MIFIVNTNLPHMKSYNVKNYEENGRFLAKVTKRRNIVLLKVGIWVGILRQKTHKTESKWESYEFYKIIAVIKYRLKTKIEISQNN